MNNYDPLIQSALADLSSCDSIDSLDSIRVKYFGKNGEVTGILKKISSLPNEEKKEFGKKLNLFKQNFFQNLEKKKILLEKSNLDEKLRKGKIDISLPTRDSGRLESKIHPITHTINETTFSEYRLHSV